MERYILAHDLGTSGNKATLFHESGRLIDSYISSYPTHYFNENWVEQNPNDWWDAVCSSTLNILKNSNIDPKQIEVVSFSGQMMGCLVVDKKGEPLRPSIIWADQRSVKQSMELEKTIAQTEFYQIVGHRNTPSYGIQKLMWIRDNESEIYKKTYKTLNAKDYIVFKLTGKFVTDYSDGNSMGCFDLKTFTWSKRIIEASNIEISKLPDLKPSTYQAGVILQDAAKVTGLAEGTKVVIGAGDGVTASIGAGSVREGKTYCSLGTSAWVTTTSKNPIFDPEMRIVTWAHAIPGYYAPNGTMQYAGGSFNWMKETLCQAEIQTAEQTGSSPYDLINKKIEKASPGSQGVLFLPYLLGERAPRWDTVSKGSYLGIKSDTTHEEMLRSVVEGVTYNLGIVFDILKEHIDIEDLIVIGGGAKSKVWCQIIADVFQLPVHIPNYLDEAGSMGAAIIGGVGAGIYDSFDVIENFLHIQGSQQPNPQLVETYQLAKRQFDDFYFAIQKVYEKYKSVY